MELGQARGGKPGFTLIEVLVALGVLTVLCLAIGGLFAIVARANESAGRQTAATLLATQKMEQLRGDRELQPSPPGTLRRNTPGYVEYLDAAGRPVGGGATAPPDGVYIRRWSVDPLPGSPAGALVLQVMVTMVSAAGRTQSVSAGPGRSSGEAWLVSVRARVR